MGSPETEWGRGLVTEEHLVVTFSHAFEIAQHETTQAEWTALGFHNPSLALADARDCLEPSCPVGNVNWLEAAAYANALSRAHAPPLPACYEFLGCHGRPGEGMACDSATLAMTSSYDCQGYRLPTEAEWEYAARAGTRSAFYSGDIEPQADTGSCYHEKNLDPIAWYCWNSKDSSHPVQGKYPNAWGLYDMIGNAAEWVQDGLDDWTSLPTDSVTDPIARLSWNQPNPVRVIRGGLFNTWSPLLRASSLLFSPAGPLPGDPGSPGFGFRLVRTLR